MDREELIAYINAQVQEIHKYKWIESEKQCRDIGFERAAFEWIRHYSEDFRRSWIRKPSTESNR